MINPINKQFVSQIDILLQEFDNTHAASLSVREEVAKYEKVNRLRDDPNAAVGQKDLWEEK